jgi:ParB-like chromosome segregation protein Spo0J
MVFQRRKSKDLGMDAQPQHQLGPVAETTELDLQDLEFHELANKFPLMEGKEFQELVEDVRVHRVREPITLFEGKILDGRNRYRAAKEAGIELMHGEFYTLGEGVAPQAFVISANYHRRHLTADQKRAAIAEKILANPEASDRQIAEEAKVSHRTVAAQRADMLSTGQVVQSTKRTGKDGRARPVATTSAPKPKPRALATIKENWPRVTDDASQQEIFSMIFESVGIKKIKPWFKAKGYVVSKDKGDDDEAQPAATVQ